MTNIRKLNCWIRSAQMIMKLLLDEINTIVIETHGNTTKFEQPAGHGIDQENYMYLPYGSVYNPYSCWSIPQPMGTGNFMVLGSVFFTIVELYNSLFSITCFECQPVHITLNGLANWQKKRNYKEHLYTCEQEMHKSFLGI